MKEKMKFEEAMELLEKQVRDLEPGNMTIDEALTAYEESVRLVKICNEKLDAAENRIRVLTEAADGTVTDSPFITSSNET